MRRQRGTSIAPARCARIGKAATGTI